MEWNEILQICREEKNTHIEGYSIGFNEKEYIGFKFTDGIIRINDTMTIRHIYKIQLHGNMLWINDDNIIIGVDEINHFEIL